MLSMYKHVVHENVVGGSSVLRVFPLVIAVSERDMPGIEPGPLGWYTSALTTGLHEMFKHIWCVNANADHLLNGNFFQCL